MTSSGPNPFGQPPPPGGGPPNAAPLPGGAPPHGGAPGGVPPYNRKPTTAPVGVFIGVGCVVLALLIGGAVWAVNVAKSSPSRPTAGQAAPPTTLRARPTRPASPPAIPPGSPTASSSKYDILPQPGPPINAGAEPPVPGSWPQWATWAPGEQKYHMDKFKDDLGFVFDAPKTWGCMRFAREQGYLKLVCRDDSDILGSPDPNGLKSPGGRLVARTCAAPCDAQTQRRYRTDILTWGQRWVAPDENSTFVEFRGKDADGEIYGVTLSRFVASKPGGPRDRQIVLQLSGPVQSAPAIQKMAAEIRRVTGA